MLSITGFGQTGPRRESPGFGKIAEGMSGLVWLTGSPDQNPLFVGYSLADTTAGLFGVFAINWRSYRRDVQGAGGAHIDLALYEPMLRMMEAQFAMHRAIGPCASAKRINDPYGWGRAEHVIYFRIRADLPRRMDRSRDPEGALKDVCRLVGFGQCERSRRRAAVVVGRLGQGLERQARPAARCKRREPRSRRCWTG